MSRPTLHTADAVSLAGRRWLADEEPEGAVVLVHGFTASASCPNVEQVAVALHALGLDVVSYDARGHGGSGGVSTLGAVEHNDVAAAVALARDRCDHVVVVGASMGAIAALRYAASDPDLDGVVAVSCPAGWRLPRNVRGVLAVAMTQTPLGHLVLDRFAGVRLARRWRRSAEPRRVVADVRIPIAFVHGALDRFIPVADAHELHDRAPGRRHLQIVPAMGHAYEAAGIPAIVHAVQWCRTEAALATA